MSEQFFDINKLPAQEGILLFPISMSNISTSQSAQKCYEYMRIFSPSKISKPAVGLNFVYSDYLYFNSEKTASELKKKFGQLIISHKNEFLKILQKESAKSGMPKYIPKAFSFSVWNQLYLDAESFTNYLSEAKEIYSSDSGFKEAVQKDFQEYNKGQLDENQVNFFLEEIVMTYLIQKGKVRLRNDFVEDHEKWILYSYPGKPLNAKTYFFRKNFFKLKNPKNKFENGHYDLKEKCLYDMARM
ncbi:MAG: hypothetical protein V1847_04270 [Candidatus Diapherotrites archaeon]